MSRAAVIPKINDLEIETMERLLAGKSLQHRQVIRMQIVLGRPDGRRTRASTLKVRARTVSEVVGTSTSGASTVLLRQP